MHLKSRSSDSHRPLSSFVVVADTHVNERDDSSSSPFQTNRLANDRARWVFQDIAAMDPPPKFVVHLGDIVHPVPSLPSFHEAVLRFNEIAAPVTVPVHLVPGNHDVGDKKVDWMPADHVCENYLETYRKAFGADYYSFDEGSLRFIVINSLLLNSGLADEARQRSWLERQLAQARGKRVFMFMHYPPFIHSANERGNYDNIDEPGRGWLLSLMRLPQVEAVFAGHVHNFWYDRVGSAEYYMLPSTAFLRHDFSEFYRVAPSVEFGRGDVEKVGYFVVDVHADGHVAHSIRTMGAQAKAGDQALPHAARYLAHPKTSTFDNVGVELRHPWTESMQITATGGVQEFGRKWARNDYPLLALWEMGCRLSKVPDIDLTENESRARMALLARLGHRYIVTTLGRPNASVPAVELAAAGVAAFELNVTLDGFARQRDTLRDFRAKTGTQLYYSKILTAEASHFDGQHFSHEVKAGFKLDELDEHRALIAAACAAHEIDGVTVRIDANQPLGSAVQRMMAFAAETSCLVLASLKLGGPSSAVERDDSRADVARVAQAMIYSKASTRVRYIFDTFMDVDRGYFPRRAFIDRRFNPRPAAKTFAMLAALLSFAPAVQLNGARSEESQDIDFEADGRHYRLVIDRTRCALDALNAVDERSTVFDLVSAQQTPLAMHVAALKDASRADADTLQVMLVQFPESHRSFSQEENIHDTASSCATHFAREPSRDLATGVRGLP